MQPLTEEEITTRLQKAYQPGVIASTEGLTAGSVQERLKCAAVLILLAWYQAEWQLVFTRRSDQVEHHKGQVSFPGGTCEPGETTPEATALREAREEIGLDPSEARLLGRLDDVVTITRYRVTPVVAVMPWPYPLRPEPGEVARVFTIPLSWLADRRHMKEAPLSPGGEKLTFRVLRFQPYDGEVLWGASARILLNLLTVFGI